MKYCSKCGASVNEQAGFCSSCGASLKQSGSSSASGGFWKGVAVAVGVVALVVGALWATSGRTPADETADTAVMDDPEPVAEVASPSAEPSAESNATREEPAPAPRPRASSNTAATPAPPANEAPAPDIVTEEPGFFGRMMGEEPKVFLTVRAGQELSIELDNEISTETAATDDSFTAYVTQPITVEGREAIPAGSRVMGHVAHAKRSDKVKGVAELTLEFDRLLDANGQEHSIEADALQLQAQSTQKKDAAKIGIGAGAGALVGAIIGGKKGAAIGTAVGGGAGTGVVLATRGEEVVLPQGAAITTRLLADITVEAPPSPDETD